MQKKLYIVRHGQTLFNKKNRIQGWCDSPLTKLGHRQAKATKEYFEKRGVTFDKACCSTLHRTEETLKDITDLDYYRYDALKE
ncbi:phosphoglycerate mutase family protein, partial [Dubosiella newyorkensis]